MMGMVKMRLKSIRGNLFNFVFGLSDGSTYEDADGCTLIMDMVQLTHPYYLTPTGITSRRWVGGNNITMQKMSVAGTTNTRVIRKPDNPIKRIWDLIPQEPDDPLKGIRELVQNGTWSQYPRGLTIPN